MTGALARQQADLLSALWLPRREDAVALLAGQAAQTGLARGLAAYRSNGLALAQRALGQAYPVVAQLLGDEDFAALARQCWRTAPPSRGDVGVWGDNLADLIAAIDDLHRPLPFLPDVARVEWALHCALTAADAPADTASLALLARHDPARLRLRLAPGTRCIASTHAVASVLLAHREGAPSLGEAGRRLRAGVAETCVVWRAGWRSVVRQAHAGEPDLLATLASGATLAAALDAAPSIDFAAWLAAAAHGGLLLGADIAIT